MVGSCTYILSDLVLSKRFGQRFVNLTPLAYLSCLLCCWPMLVSVELSALELEMDEVSDKTKPHASDKTPREWKLKF